MKKTILSAFSLRTMYKKGFKNGSVFWKLVLIGSVLLKILKWLFAKPTPVKVQEYELEPGEYKITVQEK